MNRGAYGKGSAEALMRRLSLTLGFYVPEQSMVRVAAHEEGFKIRTGAYAARSSRQQAMCGVAPAGISAWEL